MAYRRSISTRFTLLARERFTPSIPLIHRDDNDHKSHQKDRNFNTLHQHQSFGSRINTFAGFNTSFQDQRWSQFSISPMLGSVLGRHMSTAVGEGADKIEYMADVAEVLADKTAEVVASAAPAANEVAIAAADSAFPVAALQYLIDNVHSFTGFEWWASIVVTTLLIRGATIPLLINQLKSTTKLSLLRPQLEEIKQEMQDRGMEPKAVAEGQQRMQALFKEYGVTPFTPLKGLLFQGPVFVSFFLAISNMVEKVPSFKHGGAYWFTDLTTPDSMYVYLSSFDSTVILDNRGGKLILFPYQTKFSMVSDTRALDSWRGLICHIVDMVCIMIEKRKKLLNRLLFSNKTGNGPCLDKGCRQGLQIVRSSLVHKP